MNQQLKEKIVEAFSSVLPITVIVLLLSVIITPMDVGAIVMFLVGAFFLVVGMGFFTLGADIAMMPMGEGIGVQLSKSKKLLLVVVFSFIMGLIITIAEPDLQVLANQVPAIPKMTLILTVAVGVGVFLAIAVLRILFKVSLSLLLLIFYVMLFGVSCFVPGDFLAVAFDSGGVTTGPITVPFIMALGVGLASMRNDKSASEDSFGLVALSSIGPVLAVLILGIFYHTGDAGYASASIPHVTTTREVALQFLHAVPEFGQEVLLALAPILGVFLLFQLFTRRYKKRQLLRMLVGFGYALLGLIVFLTGVNTGFLPVGHLLGASLSTGSHSWLLVPLGMLLGYFMVSAEPAVHVLNKQVEEISGGAIPQSAMSRALSIGVAVSVGISMIRVLSGLSIMWVLLPGYAIALVLTRFVPKIFVGIAFDSGGVASGPMASCFLLPLAIGASEAAGGNVMTDAFGAVAMVAMTPLIAIQLMGLVYGRQMKLAGAAEAAVSTEEPETVVMLEDYLPPVEQPAPTLAAPVEASGGLAYAYDVDDITIYDDEEIIVPEGGEARA